MTVSQKIGGFIIVTFLDGDVVEGWFYGELPDGLLIAMDQEGREIRLFNKRWKMVASPEAPAAFFAPPSETKEILANIDRSVRPKMEQSFERLDFRPFQRVATRAGDLRHEIKAAQLSMIQGAGILESTDSMVEFIEYSAARTGEILDLHEEVFRELDRVQIPELVEQVAEALPNVSGRYLLPIGDASTRSQADGLSEDLNRWRNSGWNGRNHRETMTKASTMKDALLGRALSERQRSWKDTPKERAAGSRMRYFAASLRILGGTALSVANVGLGLSAGLASTIVTLGATAVPAYVGVITSVGTGLFQAAEGLEKIGGVQKDEGDAAVK